MSKKVRFPFPPSDHGQGPHYNQPPKQEYVFHGLIITAAIVIVLAGIKAASVIIAPMLLALFATIILLVPLRWLQSKGCPSLLSLVIVLGCVAIFFFGLTRVVVRELTKLSDDATKYAIKIEHEFRNVENWLKKNGFRIDFGEEKKPDSPENLDPTHPEDHVDSPENNVANGQIASGGEVTDMRPTPQPSVEPDPHPETLLLAQIPDIPTGDIAVGAENNIDDMETDEQADKTLFEAVLDYTSGIFPSRDENDFEPDEEDIAIFQQKILPPVEPSLIDLNAQNLYSWFTKTVEVVRHLIESSFLVFIMTIFMIFEASRFPAKIDRAFGKGPITNEHLHKIANEIRRYLFLKAFTSFLSGAAATMVYLAFGVQGALFWGLIAVFLYFIPNLGGIIASIIPGLLIFMDGGVPWLLLYVVCLIAIECTLAYGIDPKILGHGLGISTVVIILSLIIWGWLLGAIGLFLAAPLTIMVKIILQAFKETEWVAVLIGDGSRRSQ